MICSFNFLIDNKKFNDRCLQKNSLKFLDNNIMIQTIEFIYLAKSKIFEYRETIGGMIFRQAISVRGTACTRGI